MDAIEFLRDFRRMCSSYGTICTGCKLKDAHCIPTENNCDHEKVIRVVEEWAKEHPAKTRLSEFVKIFPNSDIYDDFPKPCPTYFDRSMKCDSKDCVECKKKFWLTPIEEEEE